MKILRREGKSEFSGSVQEPGVITAQQRDEEKTVTSTNAEQ